MTETDFIRHRFVQNKIRGFLLGRVYGEAVASPPGDGAGRDSSGEAVDCIAPPGFDTIAENLFARGHGGDRLPAMASGIDPGSAPQHVALSVFEETARLAAGHLPLRPLLAAKAVHCLEATLRPAAEPAVAALRRGLRVRDVAAAARSVGSGDNLASTVCVAVLIYLRYSTEVVSALDTATEFGRGVAEMTGALCGAHVGASRLPRSWTSPVIADRDIAHFAECAAVTTLQRAAGR